MENNSGDKAQTVSRFEHENALWHYNMCNRRMFIALLAVCVTCIMIIMIFVLNYNTREKRWQDNFTNLLTTIMEVQSDGVFEHPGS